MGEVGFSNLLSHRDGDEAWIGCPSSTSCIQERSIQDASLYCLHGNRWISDVGKGSANSKLRINPSATLAITADQFLLLK